MKHSYALLFILTFISCFPGKRDMKVVIEQVRQKHAPDSRDDVFDVRATASKNGKPVLKGYTSLVAAKDELLQLLPQAIDSVTILPDSTLGDEIYGIVNVSVADVRTHGDYSAEMATQLLLGMPLRLLQHNRWWRIRTPEGYLGWTAGSAFTRMNKAAFNEWLSSEKVIFTDIYGFSHAHPAEKSQTVSDLVFGNILRLTGEQDDFYQVAYPAGDTAYIRKSEAKPLHQWLSELRPTEESIIEKALLLKGIPYTWGGTSTKMMDCSGFTKTVFLMNGIVLLRDASQQATAGIPVDIANGYDNLHKGDLMFFGKKGEHGKKDRIRHTGIYMGNKEFIHEAGFVRIASLDPAKPDYDELNTREFVQARRILGAVGTKGVKWLNEIMTNEQ
ncbi:MAG: C40 family peptidase [Tannerella sp.]|jgi:cell wall-associated NlpC family hydrolase|nr:C40 family peptidase [Tannerella sp.]